MPRSVTPRLACPSARRSPTPRPKQFAERTQFPPSTRRKQAASTFRREPIRRTQGSLTRPHPRREFHATSNLPNEPNFRPQPEENKLAFTFCGEPIRRTQGSLTRPHPHPGIPRHKQFTERTQFSSPTRRKQAIFQFRGEPIRRNPGPFAHPPPRRPQFWATPHPAARFHLLE